MLLSIIGGLERPPGGRVEVDGEEVTAMSPDGVARMLRERVAFIFQSFGLLPVLSAAENVGLPMRLIRSIAHGEGITAIVATHDNALIELADRVLELKDGKLVS